MDHRFVSKRSTLNQVRIPAIHAHVGVSYQSNSESLT